mmetsp:Transcript_30624/g.84452  ORF Transcript_30624/g.84452 Transcript_30624/m.84452 type:complete len:210 (+) Transcript_30624:793-1422(+)
MGTPRQRLAAQKTFPRGGACTLGRAPGASWVVVARAGASTTTRKTLWSAWNASRPRSGLRKRPRPQRRRRRRNQVTGQIARSGGLWMSCSAPPRRARRPQTWTASSCRGCWPHTRGTFPRTRAMHSGDRPPATATWRTRSSCSARPGGALHSWLSRASWTPSWLPRSRGPGMGRWPAPPGLSAPFGASGAATRAPSTRPAGISSTSHCR